MKRIFIIIIFLCIYSNPLQAMIIQETIIDTVHNAYQPDGRMLDIKNIDFIRVERVNMNYRKVTHMLNVYVWVLEYLGEEAHNLKVVDVNSPDNVYPKAYATYEGVDKNLYSVYRISIPVWEHFSVDLYAWVVSNNKMYYSNQDNPDSFFHYSK